MPKVLCLFIKINAAVASSRFYYAIFTQSLLLTTFFVVVFTSFIIVACVYVRVPIQEKSRNNFPIYYGNFSSSSCSSASFSSSFVVLSLKNFFDKIKLFISSTKQ